MLVDISMPRHPHSVYDAFVIVLPIIFWAFAFPFIKLGLAELSPINLAILRLFIACLIFMGIKIIKPRLFSPVKRADIPALILLGFFGIVVYHLGLNYGEQFISPGAASLIIATIPIFVVLLAAVFLKEHITKIMVGGIVLSLSGVVIISLLGTAHATLEVSYLFAAFTVLVASIMGAIYTIVGKKMMNRYSPFSLTAYVFLFGCLGLIPFLSKSLFEQISHLSTQGWFVIIFLGVFPTVISYVFWYVALEIRTASELSTYLYAIPVISSIISYFIFQDAITIYFIGGGLLVILGLYIVNQSRKKQQKYLK
ncbi:MAG: DMT family transporter [Candidatus Thermoplasmatota archaeon]|nr:DMT family transporter [Candidatus Thermoplasmatota archaeon]MBU1940847.1 DMT family transporter [Candidatus Thermoplasmatota archaeon]